MGYLLGKGGSSAVQFTLRTGDVVWCEMSEAKKTGLIKPGSATLRVSADE